MKRGCWLALLAVLLAFLSLGVLGMAMWAAGGQEAALLMRAKMANGERAADLYRELIAVRGPDPELYLWMGQALADANQDPQAIDAWEQAAEIDPDAFEPLLEIAELSLENEAYEDAEDAAMRAIDRAPDSWRPRHIAGLVAAERDDHLTATQHLEEALELGGPKNRICYPLGKAYEALGDDDAALAAYESGADSCDSRCKERLRELRGDVSEAPPEPEVERYEGEEVEMEPAAGAMVAMMFLFYFGFFGAMMIVTWGGWIAAALAIYDCAQRDFESASTRAAWCLLLFVAHFIGAIIYYFVVYRPNTPPRVA
jgi:tetratricopeptide (TPR) repeat protein